METASEETIRPGGDDVGDSVPDGVAGSRSTVAIDMPVLAEAVAETLPTTVAEVWTPTGDPLSEVSGRPGVAAVPEVHMAGPDAEPDPAELPADTTLEGTETDGTLLIPVAGMIGVRSVSFMTGMEGTFDVVDKSVTEVRIGDRTPGVIKVNEDRVGTTDDIPGSDAELGLAGLLIAASDVTEIDGEPLILVAGMRSVVYVTRMIVDKDDVSDIVVAEVRVGDRASGVVIAEEESDEITEMPDSDAELGLVGLLIDTATDVAEIDG